MSKADPKDIKRFNDLVKTPHSERQQTDHDFILQFAKEYLHGKKPKHIMRDEPELWESHVYWEKASKSYPSPEIVPDKPWLLAGGDEQPVSEVQDEEARPKKKKSKRSRRGGEEESEEPELEQGEPGANTPRSKIGDVLATLDASGRLDDETAAKMLRDRDSTGKWKERAGLAAKLSLALALGTGVVLGVRGVVAAKKAAENVGGEVQKIQDNVGNMADNIATDPHGAAIPQRGQDSERGKSGEGAGIGKHTNQLKDRAKEAPAPDTKQKGR